MLVADEPDQMLVPADVAPLSQGAVQVNPLALFSVSARVLHRKEYRYDRGAALVPLDLALGWGPMSDQRVLDRLSISQSMRFYWFEYRQPPPIAPEEIVAHSSNMHIIPATPE